MIKSQIFAAIISMLFLLFIGCQKSSTISILKPIVITSDASSITAESANIGLTITNNKDVIYYGYCWSTLPNPTILDTNLKNIFTNFNQPQVIGNLLPNSKYYLRAYVVTNSSEIIYGNEVSFITVLPTLGMQFKGGILYYLLKQGDNGYNQNILHGLIASANDISSGVQWYNINSSPTGASGSSIGSGANNTSMIVTSQGLGNYAAKMCYDLVQNGYDDWYLPSIEELNMLSNNKTFVGNIVSGFYWSSTEANLTSYASAIEIQKSLVINFTKNFTYRVRPIRSF